MLARGTNILAKAIANHTAVPAFATYNLETVQAVVAAAEQTGQPVIMLAGSSHFHHAGRTTLISIALQAAHDSTATIGVHLDHCRALAEIELASRPATAQSWSTGHTCHSRTTSNSLERRWRSHTQPAPGSKPSSAPSPATRTCPPTPHQRRR